MTNYEYFVANMPDLYARYGHKFLAIKDCQVIGTYDDYLSAYEDAVKHESLGTFIVQEW
jgi:hypothetical protein